MVALLLLLGLSGAANAKFSWETESISSRSSNRFDMEDNCLTLSDTTKVGDRK